MGYITDFIGHVDVRPDLNEAERAYLAAFSASRRWDRPEGPYTVPALDADGPPGGATGDGLPTDLRAFHRPGPGQPGLWCHWVACDDGCCLSYDGSERFYASVLWLRWLVHHLLGPQAAAASAHHPQLAGFTFDHVLEGMVVGCRRDTKELFTIVVRDNRVGERVLRPANRALRARAPLPYERVVDRVLSDERRRRREEQAEVPPFLPRLGVR